LFPVIYLRKRVVVSVSLTLQFKLSIFFDILNESIFDRLDHRGHKWAFCPMNFDR